MPRIAELIWTGDNRSAVRALKQIADQSEKTKTRVKRDSEETATSFDRVRHSSSLLKESVAGLAGAIGFGGLTFGLKDAIEGGIKLQGAQAQLQIALRGSKGAFEQLSAAAERASTHGGFTTPQNLQVLTAFVRETHSATSAQRDFTLSTNIARGANIDLASASSIVQSAIAGRARGLQKLLGPMALAKSATFGLTKAHQQEVAALENQAKSLGKLGPAWLRQQEIMHDITPQAAALATLQDKNANAQQILSAASVAFGGSTAAFSNTTQGRLSNLQHSFQNLADTTGQKLLPAVNFLAKEGTVVASILGRVPAPVLATAAGLTILGTAVGVVRGAYGNLLGVLRIFGRQTESTAGKMATLGIAAERTAIKEDVAGGVATAGAAGVGGGLFAKLLTKVPGGKFLAEKVGLKGLLRFGGEALIPATVASTLINHVPFLHGLKNPVSSFLGFASGGVVPRYMAGGGPMGTDTVPAWLTPGEGVLSLRGMQALGALNAGGAGGPSEITIRVPIRLDSRVLTEAVARYSLNRAARGPTSLVGGSLVTGAPGLPA